MYTSNKEQQKKCQCQTTNLFCMNIFDISFEYINRSN